MERTLLAPCGTCCEFCPYYTEERAPHCSGCGTHRGQPFWGDCKLYACATKHEVEHCGLCTDFPCELLVSQFDPEHGPKSAVERIGLLAYRKKAGTRKYLELVRRLKDQEEKH